MYKDELQFMKYCMMHHINSIDTTVFPLKYKRRYYIVNKWFEKGYIDIGSSINTIWMTAKGEEYFNECLRRYPLEHIRNTSVSA